MQNIEVPASLTKIGYVRIVEIANGATLTIRRCAGRIAIDATDWPQTDGGTYNGRLELCRTLRQANERLTELAKATKVS